MPRDNIEMTLKGGQAYLDDMFSMNEDDTNDLNGSSEIANFFAGRKVLITGGSGFLGKLLVEKLLRSCPDIATLYMFMRTKKGKSPEERFKEHFDDIIFDRLKQERPYFKDKIVMVQADTSETDLGLSPESRERLKDTEIIFHGAATVRFDEKLRLAVNINIRGTKELLLFAKEMPNLKAFVHVSTAFSFCVLKFIEEKFYDPPMTTDNVLTLMELLNDDQLTVLTPTLLGEWPNTYAFTKAIAEDTVRQYSSGIPSCIVRPSIMIATAKEPICGWINNLYGPTGVAVGAAYGILRTLHCQKNLVADIIPADIVINNIIVAAWDTAQKQEIPRSITDANENKCTTTEEIPIYNSVSSVQKPVTWGDFMHQNAVNGLEIPSEKVFWYYMLILNRYKFMHNVCVVFLHLLPAAVIDTLAYLTGKKPILWNAYKKIHKFSAVISYFSTQQWRFKNDAVMSLWERLPPIDKQIFDFNIDDLDWETYYRYYIRGLRLYIAKDPMDTLDQGRIKYRKLKIAHYSLVTVVCLLVFWGLYTLINFLCTWLLSS
ncbi:hypothetical protein KPH14_004426 [Odynerus spinipes]|uniref:Fatty acyl-CoA reductase n=1 Tax=Odynerus spinipes TaxID=1348599 RepID=A0AAD9RYR7_9HYME|nr:hypothetical protein KPH14_004426 [Odynerus spinipes]